ncbi:hypothetical protein WMY93_009042 [Mugilogobius chulae]|uniref:Uncharacterized protein n=1 Tax=Mugilogobius chulae TaxID=88201 RepID=A0AAW0PJK7_9GOBI
MNCDALGSESEAAPCACPAVMEQPPGTADDLQAAQDIPAVVDLTRRAEPCAMVRRNPVGWYQDSDQTSAALSFPDPAPCTVQSGGQILPDNALSHTTVTLSYVSRSHVFSTQDSQPGNSSVYGVPHSANTRSSLRVSSEKWA